MIILTARSFVLAALLALATVACGGERPGALAETRQTVQVAGSHDVDLRFRLQPL